MPRDSIVGVLEIFENYDNREGRRKPVFFLEHDGDTICLSEWLKEREGRIIFVMELDPED